jgi:hypothetical protein
MEDVWNFFRILSTAGIGINDIERSMDDRYLYV